RAGAVAAEDVLGGMDGNASAGRGVHGGASDQLGGSLVVRRDSQEGHAEQRVRACRERRQPLARAVDLEVDLYAVRAADPLTLQALRELGPVEPIQAVEQSVGISGDSQEPLLHHSL